VFTDYFPRPSTPLQRHTDICRQSAAKLNQAELETASEAQLSHMEGGKAAKAARQQKAKIESK
jgi:hypothetical protein